MDLPSDPSSSPVISSPGDRRGNRKKKKKLDDIKQDNKAGGKVPAECLRSLPGFGVGMRRGGWRVPINGLAWCLSQALPL